MKHPIIIDIRPLVPRDQSGVAHYLSSTLMALDALLDEPEFHAFSKTYKVLVPHRAKPMVYERYPFNNLQFKSIFLPFRVINLLVRKGLLPPLDLFFGKGLYVFTGFARSRLLRSSSVVFVYDMVHKHFPESTDARMASFLDSRLQDSLANANGIITISKHARDDIAGPSKKIKNKTHVVSPSVNTRTFYRRSVNEIAKMKNSLEISGAYILSVGNLEPRKNIDTLVEAYAQLPEDLRSRYSLVIAGASSWSSSKTLDTIKHYRKEGLKIKLLISKVSDQDMPALYSGASLFIFPSLYEGYGMPVIEAMACGVPVIASTNSSLPEATGSAALSLKSETDPSELSSCIKQVLTDPSLSKELSKKGLTHIDNLPTWRDSAVELHAALQHIVDSAIKENKS